MSIWDLPGAEFGGTRGVIWTGYAFTVAFAVAPLLAEVVNLAARHAERAADRNRLTAWTWAVLWTAAQVDRARVAVFGLDESGVLDVAALPQVPAPAARHRRKGRRR